MNNSTISIPVPTELFIGLAEFLRGQGSDRDPVEAVDTAIRYWIDNASWKQEDLLPEIFTRNKGYTWKEVFLPHGTEVRMKYLGKYHYAKIEGDDLIYEGSSLSPGAFANQVADSSRSAWRDLEIRRPDDKEWFPANELRKAARKARKGIGV